MNQNAKKFQSLKLLTFSFLFLILCSSISQAQNNECFGPDPTGAVGNPTAFYAVLPDHNTLSVDGTPITSNYTYEVRLGATIVTTQQLPKSSFTLRNGTPINCYQVPFPSVTVSNTNIYQLALRGNGPYGNAMYAIASNGFFIQGAPVAPGSFRLAILNMLSKMWDRVLSTSVSKNWFKPIGK